MANNSWQGLRQSHLQLFLTSTYNIQYHLHTSLKKTALHAVTQGTAAVAYIYDLSYMCLYSLINAALLSRVASKDENELQIWARPELELIDERSLNLSTTVPTIVVTNTVARGRDTLAVIVAILPALQTLLPSNLWG